MSDNDEWEAEINAFGETVPVTFERPDVVTRARLITRMPENVARIAEEAEIEDATDADDVPLDRFETEDFEWMEDLIKETTDLPDDVVESVPVQTFFNMVEPSVQMIVDEDPGDIRIDTGDNPDAPDVTLTEIL